MNYARQIELKLSKYIQSETNEAVKFYSKAFCSERLWSIPPWRYSKATWSSSWATRSRWPCFSRGI